MSLVRQRRFVAIPVVDSEGFLLVTAFAAFLGFAVLLMPTLA